MTSSFANDRVRVETDGAIGWVTFNKPERHNALSVDMWDAIPKAFDVLEEEERIRVVVLKGAGERAFISGADISQFEKERSSQASRSNYGRIAGEANRRLKMTNLPTVAMIRGYCLGGGLGVALNCDLRVASADSTFAIPAARLGVGYDHRGLRTLVDLVGPSFAKEIFFTARHFNAQEAATMGLVNRVLPVADLEAEVREICRRIAENAPLTIHSVKTIVDEIEKGVDFDRERCEEVVRACFESEDYAEGRRAFMEKRPPIFRGH